jgi:hypothetical protein
MRRWQPREVALPARHFPAGLLLVPPEGVQDPDPVQMTLISNTNSIARTGACTARDMDCSLTAGCCAALRWHRSVPDAGSMACVDLDWGQGSLHLSKAARSSASSCSIKAASPAGALDSRWSACASSQPSCRLSPTDAGPSCCTICRPIHRKTAGGQGVGGKL